MKNTDRPYFIWDYDLTDADVRRILRRGNEVEKIWMMSRILESAKLNDVWSYLTLNQVKQVFPNLRLKKPVREAWAHALDVWGG